MSVVVTGASGHLGANLLEALLARGNHVRAMVHHDRKAIAGLAVETAVGDICAPDSLTSAFRGAEVVYHLAARISIQSHDWTALNAINIEGTRNVAAACRQCGVRRLVYFSSIHSIRSPADGTSVDESCALVDSRDGTYDCSKAAAEREALQAVKNGLEVVVITPTAVMGPRDYRPSHLGEALLRLANGRLPAMVTGGYNWVDARDVAAGAIEAAKRAPSGAKYILSGHWVSLAEMATLTAQITGVPAPRFCCPEWLAGVSAPVMSSFDRMAGRRPLYTAVSLRTLHSHRNVSHEKATRELGYQPRPFRQTLFDTLRWFAENGKLARPLKLSSLD